MARKQAAAPDWDLEEHQREIIRTFMRQKGLSAARLGPMVGMSGNAFGLRVQENWSSAEPQPVFKPVQLAKVMRVLGISDANLLFRPAKLSLVPDYGDDPTGDHKYNLYYHDESVMMSGNRGRKQRIPA